MKDARQYLHLSLDRGKLEKRGIECKVVDQDVHFRIPIEHGTVFEEYYIKSLYDLGLTDGDVEELAMDCCTSACAKAIGRSIV